MRQPDPEWQTLAREPFAAWLKESDLKYHAHAVRALLAERHRVPDAGAIEVEIGANRGRFLKGLCKARPEVTFFGVEIKRGLARTANRRLARHALDNGHVLWADARLALPILFGPERLQGVYVLFPDPWWKKRHADRRLLNEPFLRMLAAHLRPGGWLVVMTDVPAYDEQVRASLDVMPELFEPIARDQLPGSDRWHLTTRERHCEADGLPVSRLFLRRRPTPDA